ncbi:MAG: calcium/sodium antiporter [Sedimentisphaerales bacterium]|nr:calcium/sodium antiporter [Sedimentisphaerales bacterium]
MNTLLALVLLAVGLLMLGKCASLLVSGAVSLANRLGVSPLVIGLTVVAMGTSAPEVAASIAAALRNAGDVAIGNVYGSNIANLALVGGICALIRPVSIKKQTLRQQIPVMLIVAILLWPVLHNLYLARLEGLGLLAVFAGLILLTVYLARKERKQLAKYKMPDTRHKIRDTKKSILFVAIGLAGLALGADLTVRGAVFLGQKMGLSCAVIGLTIIAIGTSLPELATSVAASLKGQQDISIGTLVGSNIFNTLLVTGVAGSIRPFALSARLAGVDYWVMVLISAGFAVVAIAAKGVIGRPGGALLLCSYLGYILYLLAFSI